MKRIYIFLIFLFLLGTASGSYASISQPINPALFETPFLGLKSLTLTLGDQKETVSQQQLKDWISIEPALKMSSERTSEIENIHFCPSDKIVCNLLSDINKMSRLKKETTISVSQEKIEAYLSELSQNLDRDPVNAKFKVEDNGTVSFIPDQEGAKIDIQKSVGLILENIDQLEKSQENLEINLPYIATQPEIKASEVNNLGISTLIGEGKSNFRGSPKNRIFNINVGTEKFNGVLIKPGEEFSFVKTLGPVDGEHGYAPELVIKKDKTEPEFGGGICQVSTTAFRAAINSGLKITARRNHAYPVAYYNPQGMDATVYIPRPDLRFVNNTPNYILIQTKIEGTILTFQFFGTSDNRKVEIDGPKIIEKNPDGSMKTTFTQKVYDKDGNLIINDVFNSNYDSPSKYPHPGETKLTSKPKGWSSKEWNKYKATNGL